MAEYAIKTHSGGATVMSNKANGVEIAILILAIVIVVFGGFWMFVSIFRQSSWQQNNCGYPQPFMPYYGYGGCGYGNIQYSASSCPPKETVVVNVPPYCGPHGHGHGHGHHGHDRQD